jgi:oxaloacetate decarboxylase alpha subunit
VILGQRYKVVPEEVKNYVRGYYGRPPAPIDPAIQKLVIGDESPIDVRPADLLEPSMERAAAEIGDLACCEEDVISYALFPQVARPFLERRTRSDDGKEAAVAAIAALLTQRQPAAATALQRPETVANPWKLAWRPQAARWSGLL